MKLLHAVLFLACFTACLVACRASAPALAPPEDAPYVVVLGTAQDGGLPQIGCTRPCCDGARREPERRRLVTALLVVDPRSGKRWLLDASPDLPLQVERARGLPPERSARGARPPLFDGIFLTHAHIGHCAGLLPLGREAYGVQGQRVHATPRMAAFLRANGPWSLLVDSGAIALTELTPDRPLALAADLSLLALPVPHRDEFSDTVAFLVRGPERALLYLPDIDKWERWERPLEEVLAQVDAALLDGTFFGPDELPGRDMSTIPHPFVVESLARLAALPAAERAKVWFTHLNHSNPAADPDSEAARVVRRSGSAIAFDGQIFEL